MRDGDSPSASPHAGIPHGGGPRDPHRRPGAATPLTPPAEGRVIRDTAGLDVGERVRVTLVGTDVARGFIDFVPVA